MSTNKKFSGAGGNVTLKSWQSFELTPAQMRMREKNLSNQWLDPNSTTPQSTWGAAWGENTNIPASPTESTPVETVWVWEWVNDSSNQLIDEIKNAQDWNKQLEETINNNYSENREEVEAFWKESVKRAENFYSENEKLLRENNQQISEIEAEQAAAYQDRVNRDSVLLNEKKESEMALLKAQSELQRTQNLEAVRQAKIDTYTAKRQSAWAYNKLWLWFSSGIINQSQKIATDGIARIAEIKATMSFQEATIANSMAKIEFDYDSLINNTIDTYTDKIDELKKSSINRINETNQNLLLNNYEKNNTISTIEKDIRNELKELEASHIADVQKIRDKWIEYAKEMEIAVNSYKKEELSKLDTMLQDGTISSMSPSEIANIENKLWLPAWTINAKYNSTINQGIRAAFDQIVGKGTFIWDVTGLRDEVKNEMSMWRTYDEAINIVMEREIANNPELQQALEAQKWPSLEEREFALKVKEFELKVETWDRDFNLDKYKAEVDAAYKNWTLNIDDYKAQTDRIEAMKKADESGVLGSSDIVSTYRWTNLDWTPLYMTVEPKWNIISIKNPNRSVPIEVDEVMAVPLQSAMKELDAIGWVFIADSFRSEEEQAILHEKYVNWTGWLAAPAWQSMHQFGMALDIYSDESMQSAPTPEQVAILNSYWFYQNAWEMDAGHFEFVWNQGDVVTREQLESEAMVDYWLAEWKAKSATTEALKRHIEKWKQELELDSFKSWTATNEQFSSKYESSLRELANWVAQKDYTKMKNGMKTIVSDLKAKWVNEDSIVDYLVSNWIVNLDKEKKKQGFFRRDNADFYLSENDNGERIIYKGDAFRDTEIINLDK